ncbi:M20 family peptidase [Tundrisphaera lichenicola]|uniref:M20 family peptidase n=1 Tax=Tundrisphaera lichenicola TaxID=2029860 RepID=UPI003EBED71E
MIRPIRLRRSLRIALAGLIAAPIALAAVLVIRAAYFFPSRQVTAPRARSVETRPGFADRLGRALQFRTVAARPPSSTDPAPFEALRAYLEAEFPKAHRQLDCEVVGEHSLLFRWKGTDASSLPILLMSHLDVVPAEPGSEGDWTHPPFSGQVADGFIWGRGALDVKSGALGLLEAAEGLLTKGFRPVGDVYFALGHDEETGGREGNRKAAEILRGRGVQFRFVLDEGGGLTEGIIDGIGRPVAFVGVAEKGFATIRIASKADGGHSSMPPPHTAVGMVAAAVERLESDPFPARIDGATSAMLDFLGPEMPWSRRVALANRWLTGGLIARQFAAKPSTNAMIRTTTAATVIRGGETANVLPRQAEAFVNLRLLPGDTPESALRRVESELEGLGFGSGSLAYSLDGEPFQPSRVSSTDSEGFRALQRTIAEIYPDAVVAPGLSMVATDSRYYAPISRDIYRFLPLRLTPSDLERIHGVNERIGVETYADLIGFLARLIENLSAR